MKNQNTEQSFQMAGLFTLSLRLVVGWTYFSAFWRRLVIANKLDPEVAGYIGEKFNNFLPNAIGIKPIIEYLVSNPDALWWAMAAFTIVEAIVGLFMMLGLFTRLMSIGVFSLAMGILLGSGWIGTTCLDEWQIGILGVATGFTIFLTGSGRYSLDYYLLKKEFKFTANKLFSWFGSGVLPIRLNLLHKIVFGGSMAILALTLFTNQHFHGGVWGTLHNKSVKPKIEISQAEINNNTLSFQIYRVEGADVYGSFLIGIKMLDSNGNTVLELDQNALASFPEQNIDNRYVAKIKSGKHSMIIPLGAKATLSVKDERLTALPDGNYEIMLTDISGATWSENITTEQ